MIAFFDTNIYIDYLRGALPAEMYLRYFQTYVIRLCPIVYHELLRGIRSPSVAKKVTALGEKVALLPPPTTAMWCQAGRLLNTLAPAERAKTHEELQNDVLIALTARHNGATLITRDTDFKRIQRLTPFSLLFHPANT